MAVGEFLAGILTGKGQIVKPKKRKAEYSRTTGKEKKKIDESFDRQEEDIKTRTEAAKGDLKSRQEGVSELGNLLVDQTRDTYNNIEYDPRERTVVGQTGDRGTSQLDRGGVRGVDFRTGQAYQRGQGSQFLNTLGTQLLEQTQGGGPSLATEQFERANEANIAASIGQQASLRGGYDPAAARQIRQAASEASAQTARDAASARLQEQLSAQRQLGQTGAQLEQIGQVEGAQSLRQAGQLTGQELQARQQDVGIEKTNALLMDEAFAQEFEADLRENLQQSDLDAMMQSEEFQAGVNQSMQKANAVTGALDRAYMGEVEAMEQDVRDYNQLVAEGLNAGLNLSQAREAFKRKLIQEGKQERIAQIMADNAHAAALENFDQQVKNRQAAVAKGAVNLASRAAAAYATGGMSEAGRAAKQGAASMQSAQNPSPSPGMNTNPTTQYFPDNGGSAEEAVPLMMSALGGG